MSLEIEVPWLWSLFHSDHPWGENFFSAIWEEFPVQLRVFIASCPITSYLWEEPSSAFSASSEWVVEDTSKIFPHLLPFLKAEPTWLSRSLLVHDMLKPPGHQVELLQKVPVCLVLGSAKLGAVLQMWSDNCWMEWKKNQFPWPASYTFASTAQYLFALLLQDSVRNKSQSELEILWIAFVRMQPSCPSLPSKSASLGLGAFWTGGSTEGSWSLLKISVLYLIKWWFQSNVELALSFYLDAKSFRFLVLLLISWTRAFRMNL